MPNEYWLPQSDQRKETANENVADVPKAPEQKQQELSAETPAWLETARRREEDFKRRIDQWAIDRFRQFPDDPKDSESYFAGLDALFLDGNVAKDHASIPGLWDDDAKLMSFASELAALNNPSADPADASDSIPTAVEKYQNLLEDYVRALEEGQPYAETFLALMGIEGVMRRFRPRG